VPVSFYPDSLLGRLEQHLVNFPDQVAFRFLRDQGGPDVLTFAGLAARVRCLAHRLRDAAMPGERVMLLYPQGLEFICAFLACQAAGLIPVPAYPPRRNRKADRLTGIIAICTPALVLTTAAVRPTISDSLCSALILTTDEWPTVDAPDWDRDLIRPDGIAFLQYTSGSTGAPKGVVVTHRNIAVNERQIEQSFGHMSWKREDQVTTTVTWLPLFHDMGLIGNALNPLYVGFPSVILSPVSFLQEPVRLLQAIAEYRGTTTGAPNFAYDHCTRSITDEQKAGLDLSSLRVLYNGAEPIRAETLDRFAAAFRQCGFRPDATFPCYGLAEATLFLCGGPCLSCVRRMWVSAAELERGRITPLAAESTGSRCLVSSGKLAEGTEIVAVDTETRRPATPGTIGELWAKSESVAAGYWEDSVASDAVFSNHLADTGEGPFLATGDLGFVVGRDVYVTGRVKDMIIIRGRNIYPHDVEAAVERSLPFV
jgi:acyl-CoA synthetase (AMP-forming)/AMP-acid ligase II